MANNSVDKLNIEITADASKAKKAISDLTKGVEILRSEVKSVGQGSSGIKEIAKDAEAAGKSVEQVAKKTEKVSAAVDTAGKKAGESLKKEADDLKFSIDAVRKRIQSEKWIPDDKRAKWLSMANAGTGNSQDPAHTLRIRAQMLSEILDEQKRLAEMTDEEKAAKERVLEQDREKLRLYKEASALMKEFMPATAYPVGGVTYRAGKEWFHRDDFIPGGKYYDAAKASQNAPFKDFGFQEYQWHPLTDEEEAWFADPKNWGLDDGTDEGAQQATEAINQVKEASEELKESLSSTGSGIEAFKARFSGVGSVISKVVPVALGFVKVALRVQRFFVNFTIGAFSEGLRQAARITKVLAGHLANLAKRLISMPFKAMGNHAKSSVGSMSDALRQGARFVTRYVLGFRSLFYLARRLRGAISSAFTNLSQYSSETNENLSLLSSRLEQAKNSLATAFDPILTIITPILDHFIQLLIGAMNVVGQFFATLSGASTWKKATFNMQDFAASADNSAASSGRAADAAEKLKKSLMGFDKINKLDDPNESSSGSGGGGGSGSSGLSGADMFTTETVNTGISNFAQMVKDAWAKEDFTDVGNFIGEKIGTALSNIPWDKAKKKAEGFAKSFATFFNGLLASEITDDKGNKITLGDAIGNAIAETINTGITFLQTLTDTIKFDQIGSFIAKGMNTMTITVNWDGIAKTLSNAANGVFTAAATWSGEFKFGALATEIKDAAKKALNGITWDNAETAATNIGKGLADAMNVFFTEDLFDSISTALAGAVNTAITGGYTFIGRIEWEQWGTTIKNGIVNFFSRIKWKEIGVTAANLATGLGTVVNTLFETGNTLIGRIEWKEWGETIKNGINNFFDTVKWENIGVTAINIATGLAKAINTLFEGAYTLLGRIEWSEWGKTVGIAITNFFKTVNWEQVGVTFSEAATGFAKFIREAIETIDFKEVGSDVATALGNIDWGTLFIEASKLIVVAAEALAEFVGGLLSGLQKALEDWVKEHFPKVVADIIFGDGVVDANDRPNGVDTSLTGNSNPVTTLPGEEPTMTVHLSAKKDQSYIDNVDNDFDKTEDKDAKVSTFGKMMTSFTEAKTQFASLVNQDVLKTVKGEVKSSFDNTKSRFDSVFDNYATKYAQGEEKPSFTKAMTDFRNWTNDEVKKSMTAEELKAYTDAEDAFYDWADQQVTKRLGAETDKAGTYKSLREAWVNWHDEDAKKTLLAAWDDQKDWTEKKKEYDGITNTDAIKTMMAEFGTTSSKVTTGKGKNKKTKTVKLTWDQAKKQWASDIASGDALKTLKGKQTDSFTNASKAYGKLDSDTATITFDGRKTSSLANAISAFADTLNNKISSAKELWSKVYYKALGGAFYGGSWHDIPQYAAGAVPTHGTVFVAGERGAEAVANIGGRTEVLNQSQMASVMYDAVLRGMVQAMSVAGNGTVVEVHLDSDARKMFRVIQTEANNYTNATGRPAFNM